VTQAASDDDVIFGVRCMLNFHGFRHIISPCTFFFKPFYLSHEYYVAKGEVHPLKRMNLHFLIHGANYIENLYNLMLDSGSFQKGQNFYLAHVVTYHSIYI
jgi:hypothetical protein